MFVIKFSTFLWQTIVCKNFFFCFKQNLRKLHFLVIKQKFILMHSCEVLLLFYNKKLRFCSSFAVKREMNIHLSKNNILYCFIGYKKI